MAVLTVSAGVTVRLRLGSTHVASIVHVLRVPPGRNGRIGRDAVVDRVDASERVDIHFQVGQSDIGAWLERCSITPRGRVKEVDGGEDSVGINPGATTTSIGGKVATCGVFVCLSGRLARKIPCRA